MNIGSTVWIFDINRRRYRPAEPGRIWSSGGPIWREHWAPYQVVGETSRSWLLEQGKRVPKNGADPRCVAFSLEEIERQAFMEEHQHHISDAVRRIGDYETLLKVAELIGYKAAP